MAERVTSRLAIIVVAAGSGTRLGYGHKAFVEVGGHSILQHALHSVFASDPAQLVIVTPTGREAEAMRIASHVASDDQADRVRVVVGGASRQDSVAAGIRVLDADIDVVLVHDAARAFAPPEVFARVIAAVDSGTAGVIPVLPVVDTLKRVSGTIIEGAVNRAELAAAQTPQGFRRQVLEDAYRNAEQEFTDDAALVASVGNVVETVQGDARSFKITTPDDLERVRVLLTPPGFDAPRVGIGTDVHAFADGGTLWLAGLEWPGERALSGHSDGDAVAHAMVDALLAAAGLGDIGTHFGTDRPEFAGAHADAFLRHTLELIEAAGWRVGNVSVQVQTSRPRFSPRRVEAERALSAALGGAAVTVSATTTDGLGFTGRGDGASAFAVALLLPR